MELQVILFYLNDLKDHSLIETYETMAKYSDNMTYLRSQIIGANYSLDAKRTSHKILQLTLDSKLWIRVGTIQAYHIGYPSQLGQHTFMHCNPHR
jgi:hypothetical protein